MVFTNLDNGWTERKIREIFTIFEILVSIILVEFVNS
jgi:hypothetical protein